MKKISSKHFVLFILGVSIVSVKTYMSIFIDVGGRDTWLSSLLASIVFIGCLLCITKIYKSTNASDINEIYFKALPKPFALIFLFIFILALFINSIEAAAVEANVLHTTLFIDTPVWYALIFFIAPTLFIFNKSIRTILIFILVSVSIFIANGFAFFIFSQSYKDINYLLPVFGSGISSKFFITALMILGGLSSFMIAIPFIKFIDKSEHINKHSFYAGTIVIAFIVISFVGAITAFGPLRAANIFYPEFVLSQRIEVAGFLEMGELFFIIQTVIGFFVKYVLSTYAIIIILDRYLKNKPLFIGIYTFIVYVLSNFLGMNNIYLYTILKYIQIVNLIAFIVIPLLVFNIYNLRFRRKKLAEKHKK
ncbi:endospore germination permease [Clostridium sp. AL.422]|uniref:GerAB/ArcD/ProY family transporter n=1 Tax=Clostridium TaxID=1485 RepID=UPI00293DC4E5|nr:MULTISPECIES: endospore germination permease [unclassified Clostridium]MDV4150009.1 endospore germination permease [Clostridium sp. AL.422]